MNHTNKHSNYYLSVVLAVLAGIFYCSWPLGPLLNPLAARHGFASELGGTGQPYNWVFIGGDIVAGVLMLASCWLVWHLVRSTVWKRYLAIVLIWSAIFAIAAAIDASLPVSCLSSLKQCPGFEHDPMALAHDIFGVFGAFALFVPLHMLWRLHKRDVVLTSLYISYSLSGLASIRSAFSVGHENLSQHILITTCSLIIAVLPWKVLAQSRSTK